MLDTFTTVEDTRKEAGFSNNTNITDSDIQPYVDGANGEVITAIATKYVLPLSNNAGYTGSSTENYLKSLTTNLAGGLLLLRQYEGTGGDMEDLAIAKISNARSQIQEIQKGTRFLIGSDGAEFAYRDSAINVARGISGDFDGLSPKFTMDDIY